MKKFLLPLILFLLGFLTFYLLTGGYGKGQDALPTTTIEFIDPIHHNKKAEFHVELALNDQSRQRGLMHRQDLAPYDGMLFRFDNTQLVHMWMKNTPLPLDMIFIGDDNRIKTIIYNTTPYSENIISSGKPIKWVLEVMAGDAKKFRLRVNDMMVVQP